MKESFRAVLCSYHVVSAAPSGPPTGVSSTTLSSSSIILRWALPRFEDRNGDITGFIINVTNLDSGLTHQFTTALVYNYTLSNLRPFTVYVATIAARTAVGMGPFSVVVSSQTFEDGEAFRADRLYR